MSKIQKLEQQFGEDVDEQELLFIWKEDAKSYSHSGRQFIDFYNINKHSLTI